jgi:hypothetical protein
MAELNIDAAKDEVAETLKLVLQSLIDGTAEDLAGVASEIALDVTEAMATGREDLVDHLTDQAKVLLSTKRLELSAAGRTTLRTVLLTAIRVAATTLGAVTV